MSHQANASPSGENSYQTYHVASQNHNFSGQPQISAPLPGYGVLAPGTGVPTPGSGIYDPPTGNMARMSIGGPLPPSINAYNANQNHAQSYAHQPPALVTQGQQYPPSSQTTTFQRQAVAPQAEIRRPPPVPRPQRQTDQYNGPASHDSTSSPQGVSQYQPQTADHDRDVKLNPYGDNDFVQVSNVPPPPPGPPPPYAQMQQMNAAFHNPQTPPITPPVNGYPTNSNLVAQNNTARGPQQAYQQPPYQAPYNSQPPNAQYQSNTYNQQPPYQQHPFQHQQSYHPTPAQYQQSYQAPPQQQQQQQRPVSYSAPASFQQPTQAPAKKPGMFRSMVSGKKGKVMLGLGGGLVAALVGADVLGGMDGLFDGGGGGDFSGDTGSGDYGSGDYGSGSGDYGSGSGYDEGSGYDQSSVGASAQSAYEPPVGSGGGGGDPGMFQDTVAANCNSYI